MISFVTKEKAQERYDHCKKCEHFVKKTTTCLKCWCFMKLKVTVSDSECPIGKWK
jgi:hypothetical protein